jgi:hypothetical protein
MMAAPIPASAPGVESAAAPAQQGSIHVALDYKVCSKVANAAQLVFLQDNP